MLWTLQRYIFREMGKAFLLVAVGLLIVIGLGGGVMNMIDLEGLTAFQMIKVLTLFVPIAATLSLPIAALYAATVTYGRLSADNELTACRSGGINIHILLLPALFLSILAAATSFLLINFVIPNLVRNLDWFIREDLPRLVRQKLSSSDPIKLGDKYVLYSKSAEMVEEAEGDEEDSTRLRLHGIAFVEMDDETWVRYGTARTVELKFGADRSHPTIAADMFDLTVYDAREGQYADHRFLPIGHYPLPQQFPVKVKWLTLGGLLQYGRQPSLFPEVKGQLDQLRAMIARLIFTRQLRQQFESGAQEGWIVLQTPDIEYRLRADELHLTEEQPRLKGNVEIIERHTGGPTRRIKAESVAFKEDRSTGMVQINAAGNVTIHSEDHPDRPVKRNTERLPPIPLPQPVLKEAATWTDARLLDPDGSLVSLGRRVEERRQAVLHKVGEIDREITGELHARTAFALSVLVLVILGAGLAIVLRNAQVLVAFGISFIPSVAVVTLVIAGKQLIEKPPTVQAGIAVIWAGLALVAILDLYILTRVVRR